MWRGTLISTPDSSVADGTHTRSPRVTHRLLPSISSPAAEELAGTSFVRGPGMFFPFQPRVYTESVKKTVHTCLPLFYRVWICCCLGMLFHPLGFLGIKLSTCFTFVVRGRWGEGTKLCGARHLTLLATLRGSRSRSSRGI